MDNKYKQIADKMSIIYKIKGHHTILIISPLLKEKDRKQIQNQMKNIMSKDKGP